MLVTIVTVSMGGEKKKQKKSRRKSREIALSILYSREFADGNNMEETDYLTKQMIEMRSIDDEYARYLIDGVYKNLNSIDEQIKHTSRNWRIERMSLIDKNILRIGVFELNEGAIPLEIIINESVELAKTFGDEKSSNFVNGILDAVAKSPGIKTAVKDGN